jgi:hypothetical protein
MPFLTDIDARAAIKGSRDPLGLVPVWARFGRAVVGNLTTVSNSVRGFTTTLLGYYFAERVIEETQSSAATLDLFLKFEQLAGYSRLHHKQDPRFRGMERVSLRLQKSSTVTIGASSREQILGNQKTYGLWGLFSVPTRDSGLLADRVLTAASREFIEKQYIKSLASNGRRADSKIVDLLRRERADVHLNGRDKEISELVATVLSSPVSQSERTFYGEYLANGGESNSTDGRQPLLTRLLAMLPATKPFDFGDLHTIISRASRMSDGGCLADSLTKIAKLESLLVPMENAFWFMLSRDGQTIATTASQIQKAWGKSLRHVDPDAITSLSVNIGKAFQEEESAAKRFVDIAQALEQGSYETVLHQLLEHNAYVMRIRNGSQPWARLDGSKIDVRYRDESGALISKEDLPHRWRNTYFINSLKDVVSELQISKR